VAFSARVLNDLVNFGEKVNDPQLVVDVINIFLNESPRQLKQILKAVGKENIEKIVHEVHKLKSSSAAVGADSLVEMCVSIESILEKPNDKVGLELQRLDKILQTECAKLSLELTKFVAVRS
jgi:HPt (histidine-containing phosphotransfer) domain-containing protein